MNYLDATAEFYELDEITQKEFIEELRTAETSAKEAALTLIMLSEKMERQALYHEMKTTDIIENLSSAALQIEEALYQAKTQTLGIDYTLNDFFVF